ncbi:MAG TPA: transposase [Lentisphaeria bacterium]|nr:MAG: hypothetical protein A2X48_17630 [Lentisphaerae bacterium GWF2_49_21]HBC87580.1 transposase [Lentisphaeria bacterium]
MPRRARKLLEHRSYHITHRCHDRKFLLKFIRDRRRYLGLLRQMTRRYKVEVLGYMVTSNHVHLLLWARDPAEISEGLRFLQGTAAQRYNRRKERGGSYWSGRYKSTLIQDGVHLGRCMFYIDLNMVRNGQVGHPREWIGSSYAETAGKRKRCLIVNRDLLIRKTGHGSEKEFTEWYERTLEDKIKAGELSRESFWTESLAVGDREWVKGIAGRIHVGSKELSKTETSSSGKSLKVREEAASYFIKGGKRANQSLSRYL